MKFKSLPRTQGAGEAGEQTTREACKRFEDGEKAATDKIKSQGMKVINFSADDKRCPIPPSTVAQDWVKDVDKRGKPGSEVFRPSPKRWPPPFEQRADEKTPTTPAGRSPASGSSTSPA